MMATIATGTLVGCDRRRCAGRRSRRLASFHGITIQGRRSLQLQGVGREGGQVRFQHLLCGLLAESSSGEAKGTLTCSPHALALHSPPSLPAAPHSIPIRPHTRAGPTQSSALGLHLPHAATTRRPSPAARSEPLAMLRTTTSGGVMCMPSTDASVCSLSGGHANTNL